MSGSLGVPAPKKNRSRQKFRNLFSSKSSPAQAQSVPDNLPPTVSSALPLLLLPASLTSRTASPTPSSSGAYPSTAVINPLQVSSSAPAQNELLQDALLQLDGKERNTIEKYTRGTPNDIQSAVEHVSEAVKKKRQISQDRAWTVTVSGRPVVLRDKAESVIHWLDRFKSIGNTVAQVDPVHIGLPWAGIRMLIEVATADANQMAALLTGWDTSLYMTSRLDVYLTFWQDLPPAASKDRLRESIIELYVHILRFLAHALLTYETKTPQRVFDAIWSLGSATDFEAKAIELAQKVELDASNCDRTLGRTEVLDSLQNMRSVLKDLAKQNFDQLQASIDRMRVKMVLDNIPFAQGATFNSYDSVHKECHPSTRGDILAQVEDWAQQSHGKSIFWLKGSAGTGKSTISWTTAKRLTGKGSVELGGSFFFKRGGGDRGSAKRFFPTIIRDLIRKVPGLDSLVAAAIDSDPSIFDKALAEQFRRILLQPLQELTKFYTQRSILILVVDALDECDKESDIQVILELWPQISRLPICLRLFLTSRPELPIQRAFQELPSDVTQEINLVDAVPLNTIEHDLKIYLHDSLCSIRDRFYKGLPSGMVALSKEWAIEEQVERLVEISVPLFIVAATICRHVGNDKFDPRARLEKLLASHGIGQMTQMQLTYLPVLAYLNDEPEDEDSREELCSTFRHVVGSIIVLAEPLSIETLSLLLGIPPMTVSLQLAQLHSVLRVPNDHLAPIRTLHLSFAEFLLGEKARKQPYGIDGCATHRALSEQCIRVLSASGGLHENICNLKYSKQLRSDLDSTTINKRLTPVLQYACRYWTHHVQCSFLRNEGVAHSALLQDGGVVHSFLQKHFLHWLEALSLLDRVSDAINQVGFLQSCVPDTATGLCRFLEDARRFILMARHVVEFAPLQLYSSCIVFAPQQSLVRTRCGTVPLWIKRHPRTRQQWGSELQVLEGHTDHIYSIAFSPDGDIIATGSCDFTVRLWDVYTGKEVQKLEGHVLHVNSVAFSPDNMFAASGSNDRTVRLWNRHTGQEILKLGREPDAEDIRAVLYESATNPEMISAVAFSPDSCILATGSKGGKIRLYNMQTRLETLSLEVDAEPITSIVFSPDGNSLASLSNWNRIRIWSTQTWLAHELEGSIKTNSRLVFAPDSTRLACGSLDGSIQLWDTHTWHVVQSLKTSDKCPQIGAVAFSADGSLLAAAHDGQIWLWDMQTWQKRHLDFHSDNIYSMAFSPVNKNLIASDGANGIIRLWNTRTGQEDQKFEVEKLKGHSKQVNIVLFSPDGSILATGSEDLTIILWNTNTGKQTHKLEGHGEEVHALTFPSCGNLLASGARDGTVRLWDTETGQELRKLEGHSNDGKITDIAFSSDEALIASSSNDNSILIWNAHTGETMRKLDIEPGFPSSVAISSGNRELLAAGIYIFDNDRPSVDRSLIQLWDIKTGEVVRTLEGHAALVHQLSFSPYKEALLVSAAYDNTIRLWQAQTGQELHRLDGIDVTYSFGSIRFASKDKIITDSGTFILDDDHTMYAEVSTSEEGAEVRLPDHAGEWIRRGGQDLLWLPPDYRPRGSRATASYGRRSAIGGASGLVSFFEFDMEALPKE